MDDYVTRHERSFKKPWTDRARGEPQRTYSGRVVYNRRKHYFTQNDVARIQAKVAQTWEVERPSANALKLAIASALSFWAQALDMLSWVDPTGIAKMLQGQAQEAIRRLVWIDNEPWDAWVVYDMIQTLATKQRKFEVVVKWYP